MFKKIKFALLSLILLSVSSCCCWRREYSHYSSGTPCKKCGRIVRQKRTKLRGYKTTDKMPITTYQSAIY